MVRRAVGNTGKARIQAGRSKQPEQKIPVGQAHRVVSPERRGRRSPMHTKRRPRPPTSGLWLRVAYARFLQGSSRLPGSQHRGYWRGTTKGPLCLPVLFSRPSVEADFKLWPVGVGEPGRTPDSDRFVKLRRRQSPESLVGQWTISPAGQHGLQRPLRLRLLPRTAFRFHRSKRLSLVDATLERRIW